MGQLPPWGMNNKRYIWVRECLLQNRNRSREGVNKQQDSHHFYVARKVSSQRGKKGDLGGRGAIAPADYE